MSEEQTQETTPETETVDTEETTTDEVVEETKPVEKTEEAKVQSMLRKFKLKVDGEEIEEDPDFD